MRKLARCRDADRLRSADACGSRPGYGAARLIDGSAIGAFAGTAPLVEPIGLTRIRCRSDRHFHPRMAGRAPRKRPITSMHSCGHRGFLPGRNLIVIRL